MDNKISEGEKYLLDMLAEIDRKHQEARQPILDELVRMHTTRMRPHLPTIFVSGTLIDHLGIDVMGAKP